MKLVTKGNSKLGPRVYHTNTRVGLDGSCPGASEWCRDNCYATKGFYTFPSNVAKYSAQWDMLRDDPEAYSAQLISEVSKLPLGSIFRFHTGGDIANVGHVSIIRDVCDSRPDVSFYLYTRSWRLDAIRVAVENDLFPITNLTVWASTDPSLPKAPNGWREARVFDSFDDASARGFRVHCPEQTGKQPDCQSCGLCWKAKPTAALAFAAH